jgi:serine protease
MPIRQLLVLVSLLATSLYSTSSVAEVGRVIVKYKTPITKLKQIQSTDRAAGFARQLGLKVRAGHQLDDRTEVMITGGISSDHLAAKFSVLPEVEYSVPDRLRSIRALPNDPIFSSQWYLQPTTVGAAAINATMAWDQTTGSAGVIVAVIDTGVRFEHPDLAAKLLPGYDFISDPANSGEGRSRSPDASDPGDFISTADLTNADLIALCGSSLSHQGSSWHGTRVAGIVGAGGNNSVGITGVSWGAMILPVRAIGKCGGFDSDIIAGMRWAAGAAVPGVPANPSPAKIINLSIGGADACSQAYLDVISELTARNVLVVASAGNESGPVDSPGNCAGVLAVGGVRHIGTKVGYSSFGEEVAVSAPAGNCVNTNGACLFSIQTTTNLGSARPEGNGYTDEYNYNVGTSFSAPLVSGVAALMLSLNPTLGPADIIRRIKRSARVFPSDSALPTCPNLSDLPDSTGQCNCTTTTCGAGLLDAAAAVAVALPPTSSIQMLDPLVAGTSIRLDGTGSTAAKGLTISGWHWTLVSAPAGSGSALTSVDASTTSLQATTAGDYTVSLTVTDNLGATNSYQRVLSVSNPVTPIPTPQPPLASGGSGGGGALDLTGLLLLAGLIGLAYFPRRSSAQSVPPA